MTHDIRPSRLVSYSYAADAGRAHDHEVQFEISVTSLRAANDSVPVALFVHGELTPAFERICRALGVMVHRQGSYAGRLRRTCPRGATALALYPVLHKSLNFAELAATGVDQVLCCDLDTVFFDDVDVLFDGHRSADVVAREEVFSRRSVHGADPSFIDEALLGRLAAELGRVPIAPINLGMVLFSRRAVVALVDVMAVFVDDVWRLMCGIAAGAAHPDVAGDEAQMPWIGAVRAAMTDADVARALPYPSSNAWITEEIGFWLALGSVPGLITADFSPSDVAQNGELLRTSPSLAPWIACHYYSHNMPRVLAWLESAHLPGVDAATLVG